MASNTGQNQTRTIIALLAAAILAIGVTVVRVKDAVATPGVRAARSKSLGNTVIDSQDLAESDWHLAQNPFAKPLCLKPPDEPAPKAEAAPPAVNAVPTHLPRRRRVVFPVLPLTGFRTEPMVGSTKLLPEPAPAVALPEAILLAVVKGHGGCVCVIKLGNDPPQTVGEGDDLTNGFKVKCVGENYAVLTNGRNEIIAKKPKI